MRRYPVNRPEEGAMNRLLKSCSPLEGLVLRLAWQQGLTREEIGALTWEQVSFEDEGLYLPDRSVPLEGEVKTFLWRFREARGERGPYVVLSDRSDDRMQPESISRVARRALDRGGLKDVRLMDLRHDWIIRRLQVMDWAAVARISGVEIPALQARFSPFVEEKMPPAEKNSGVVDEFKLWKVLQAERNTPAGIALWLTWQLGLQAREIVALTWEQADVEAGIIRLPDREVVMTNAVRRLLQETRDRREAGADPHVLLTEQSRKPLDLPRLSRLTRAALIRGGMEQVRLVDLKRDEAREDEDAAVMALVREKDAISRGDVMDCLQLSRSAAYARLHRLVEQEKLVRVGGKYFLYGTVIPPEEQPEAVLEFLERWGFAYRQDIAALLGVQPKQCTVILKRLAEEGLLRQQGQKYLPASTHRREVN